MSKEQQKLDKIHKLLDSIEETIREARQILKGEEAHG